MNKENKTYVPGFENKIPRAIEKQVECIFIVASSSFLTAREC